MILSNDYDHDIGGHGGGIQGGGPFDQGGM